jgi:hypothetical protein
VEPPAVVLLLTPPPLPTTPPSLPTVGVSARGTSSCRTAAHPPPLLLPATPLPSPPLCYSHPLKTHLLPLPLRPAPLLPLQVSQHVEEVKYLGGEIARLKDKVALLERDLGVAGRIQVRRGVCVGGGGGVGGGGMRGRGAGAWQGASRS